MARTGLAALLLLLLIPVAILADVSVWVTRTVVDERAFSTTVAAGLETPAFQQALAVAAADALTDRIDGLDPTVRAVGTAALGIPNNATAIHAWLVGGLVADVDGPEVHAQRDVLIAAAHDALVHGAGPAGAVRVVGRDVVADIGGIETVIANALDPSGVATSLLLLSSGQQLVVLGRASDLQHATTAVTALRAMLPILAVLLVALALLVVLLAHHRARAIGAVGAALVIAGGLGLAGSWLTGQVVGAFVRAPVTRDAVQQVVAALTSVLAIQSGLLVFAGVAFVIVGWSIGRDQHRRAVAEMFDPVD